MSRREWARKGSRSHRTLHLGEENNSNNENEKGRDGEQPMAGPDAAEQDGGLEGEQAAVDRHHPQGHPHHLEHQGGGTLVF
jgi:hypothetical protein